MFEDEQIKKDEDIQELTELCTKIIKKYNMDCIEFSLENIRACAGYVSVITGIDRKLTFKRKDIYGNYNIEIDFNI